MLIGPNWSFLCVADDYLVKLAPFWLLTKLCPILALSPSYNSVAMWMLKTTTITHIYQYRITSLPPGRQIINRFFYGIHRKNEKIIQKKKQMITTTQCIHRIGIFTRTLVYIQFSIVIFIHWHNRFFLLQKHHINGIQSIIESHSNEICWFFTILFFNGSEVIRQANGFSFSILAGTFYCRDNECNKY